MKIRAIFIVLCFLLSTISHATLRIGTLIFKPPYILSPGNGFDVDLAEALCKRLKEQCQFIPMGMTELYEELRDNEVDLAMGGIPISYTLKINFIFSLPYMLSKGQFLVLKKQPFNSVNDLKGKSVGVLRNILSGGVFYGYLVQHYNKVFQVKMYEDIEDIMEDLNNSTISAAFLDRSSVTYWIREGGGQFKTIGMVHTLGDGIAILALPKNKKLIDRINKALQNIELNETYFKLYETYFSNE